MNIRGWGSVFHWTVNSAFLWDSILRFLKLSWYASKGHADARLKARCQISEVQRAVCDRKDPDLGALGEVSLVALFNLRVSFGETMTLIGNPVRGQHLYADYASRLLRMHPANDTRKTESRWLDYANS